jgi:D-alanyl-lipoteichoic acid acyltransferase DltB (MBOAT superfamily)
MEKHDTLKKRKPFLILSLVVNLGLLFTFKYLNFFTTSLNALFQATDLAVSISPLKVLLPVGISFYTFQTLSYSIDVYYGRQKAERHLGIFALYVSFFPQLVAGPIERFSRLAPQLKQKHIFRKDNLVAGLQLIIYGLFTKMVIADNLAVFVDKIYESPDAFNSLSLFTGMVFYAFQIYGDFFGYSLIAIGSAKIMGVNLIDNFQNPYLSANIREFWQRWHISLSTWFRDYLYFPLGGSRVKKFRWLMNIAVVFIVSGFWHGANYTFLIWGGLFAVFYLLSNRIFNAAQEIKKASFKGLISVCGTFVIVLFLWIFFRSPDLSTAILFIKSLLLNSGTERIYNIIPAVVWIMLCFFVISDILLYNNRIDKYLSSKSMLIRILVMAFLGFCIITFAAVDHTPFIYFQF